MVLALDCCSMPRLIAGILLARAMLRSLAAPRSTRATSPRLTCWPSRPRPMVRFRKSCSVAKPVAVRSVNSRCSDSRRPAGSSTFSRRRCVLDLGHGQTAGGQRLAVEPDPHRVAPLAGDADPRHAVDRAQAIDQHAVGVVGELERGQPLALEVQPHHRIGVGVDLGDLGDVGLVGQIADHPADAVAHVVGGLVHVAVERELEVDRGAFVAAGGGELDQAGQAGDPVLDHLGDLGLDHVGRGAAIAGADRDDRRVDVGQFAHRQQAERHHAEDDEQRRDHGGEHRTADRDVGQEHASASALLGLPSPVPLPPTGGGWRVAGQRHRRAVAHLERAFDDHLLADRDAAHDLDDAGLTPADPDLALDGLALRRRPPPPRTRTACPAPAPSPARAAASASMRSRMRLTVRNMPGRSRPFGFGSSARTATERVSGSTRVSTVATLPLNSVSGKALARKPPGWACRGSVWRWPVWARARCWRWRRCRRKPELVGRVLALAGGYLSRPEHAPQDVCVHLRARAGRPALPVPPCGGRGPGAGGPGRRRDGRPAAAPGPWPAPGADRQGHGAAAHLHPRAAVARGAAWPPRRNERPVG